MTFYLLNILDLGVERHAAAATAALLLLIFDLAMKT